MKGGILYLLLGALVVGGLVVTAHQLQRRGRQVAAELKAINADTGDIMSSASYQRFALRRKAVGSMRAALMNVAAVESAYVADSGRPTTAFWAEKGFVHAEGTDVWVTIKNDRWVAQAKNRYTTMSCSLTATFDTTTERYLPGQAVCADWNAESSAAERRRP